jgi:hypothetical protein
MEHCYSDSDRPVESLEHGLIIGAATHQEGLCHGLYHV